MTYRMLLVSALSLAALGLVAQPRIALRDSVFDFGTVSAESKMVLSTTVSNTGTGNLVIQDITAACDCSLPSIESHVIPPGSSTQLTVVFDSRNFFGAIDKGILIVSNDVTQRNLWVPVRAFVAQLLQPDPITVVFDGRGPGAQERSVVLRNVSSKTVRLGKVTSSIPGVFPRLTKTSLAPGDTTILIAKLSTTYAKPTAGEIIITTNRREQPKLKIQCFVRSLH